MVGHMHLVGRLDGGAIHVSERKNWAGVGFRQIQYGRGGYRVM